MMPLASATGFANPAASSLATLRENPLQGGANLNCEEDCYDDDDDDDSLSDEVDSDDLDDLYDEDDDDEDDVDEDDDVVQDEVVVRSGKAVARRSTREAIFRPGCDCSFETLLRFT